MSEPFRLLEGLDLQKLTAEEAIREIQRIADLTLLDMVSGHHVERMEGIAYL